MARQATSITRRSALKSAVALLGGGITAAQLGALSSAVAALGDGGDLRALDEKQFATLERVVDLMIPETDTPGAIGANVHRFIDMMLADWASDESRSTILEALVGIDARAMSDYGAAFPAASETQQMAVLQAIDTAAFADGAPWTPYRDLKRLVVFAYYSSEEGASVELRYDRLPGGYPGCVPLADIGRAWAT